MLYTCDACKYIFEAEDGIKQCPDCGKKAVRPANEEETKEYKNRQLEDEEWDSGGDCFG